jgi:radical SAM superfamily enzyme YgiQ (UPF0313 family)
LRVLLISTPYPLEEYPLPPLSLSYLAAALEGEGLEVQILDLLVAQYSARKVREKLGEYQPQLVGVTCVTLNYPTAARILKVCKEFDPAILTVIGGPHVSFALEETLLSAPWIDAIVIREGERTLVELARALEKGNDFRQVAGIAFREEERVVQAEPRPPIGNLDEIPFPARHLLPLSKYRALGSPCTVITSRGCPFGCIFCSGRRMFGRKVRFRSPKLVVDEMEMIYREFGFQRINIVDDTFTVNHRHARSICEELIRRNLHIQWNAFARVDTVTEELVRLMKEAGCAWVSFGIESGAEEILKTIKKGITLDGARRGVKLTTDAGIKVLNSFILGLPGESPETAQQSLAFAGELDSEYGAKYGIHILAPLPGTELYERAEDYGLRILTRNWARYDANEPITETANMSPEMVLELMADYDQAVAYAWEEIKRRAEAGDRLCEEEVREKESREFVWRLLRGDVIERLGRIRAADGDDLVEGLARKVSQRLAAPLDVARREMGRLVEQGLLKWEWGGGGFLWRWS